MQALFIDAERFYNNKKFFEYMKKLNQFLNYLPIRPKMLALRGYTYSTVNSNKKKKFEINATISFEDISVCIC